MLRFVVPAGRTLKLRSSSAEFALFAECRLRSSRHFATSLVERLGGISDAGLGAVG